MLQRLQAILAPKPPVSMLTLKQARAVVRELGFTLRDQSDNGAYRLRPVGAADDQAYYTGNLADAVKAAQQWDGTARWHPERQCWEQKRS